MIESIPAPVRTVAPAHRVERLHDLRLVRPPQVPRASGPGSSPRSASWGIALFEYLLQVPANRIGYAGGMSLAQLKILQEVITLLVFVPFASSS